MYIIYSCQFFKKTSWWFNLLAGLRTHWTMVLKEFGLLGTWRVHVGEFFFFSSIKKYLQVIWVSYLGLWIILTGTIVSSIASIMKYFYLNRKFLLYLMWSCLLWSLHRCRISITFSYLKKLSYLWSSLMSMTYVTKNLFL